MYYYFENLDSLINIIIHIYTYKHNKNRKIVLTMLNIRKRALFMPLNPYYLLYLFIFIDVSTSIINYFFGPLFTKMVKMFSSLSQLVSY